MRWFTPLPRKLGALFRKSTLDQEMSEEMRAHLEMQTEANLADGMTSDEARYTALRQFGHIEGIKEIARDQRSFTWIEHFFRDLHYALRQIRKHPGFTIAAVLSLGLGIGANTAIFSLVNYVVLKPLPVEQPDELVMFEWLAGRQGGWSSSNGGDFGNDDTDRFTGQTTSRLFSLRIFDEFHERHGLLSDVFAVAGLSGINVNVDHQAERLDFGLLVSGDYYEALGVTAVRGRTLLPEDGQPNAAPVVVLSYRYWHTRFADDPAVLGKTIWVNQVPVTVVGVTPPDFVGTMLDAGPADLTMPLPLASRVRPEGLSTQKPGLAWLRILGRLNPGVTADQARDSLEGVFQASVRDLVPLKNELPHLRVVPGGKGRTAAERRKFAGFLLVMQGMAGLIMLAACANVANLLLAQGASRRREIAVRLALGASRGRLIRQLLTESLLLGLLGAGLGLFLSRWDLDLLASAMSAKEREIFTLITLDRRVLEFTILVALLTSVVIGLAPALRVTRLNLTAEFQGGLRHLGVGARSRLSRFLLGLQVAVCLVLLVCAGLFMRTLRNLQAVDVGFNPQRLLLFSIEPRPLGYKSEQLASLNERLAARIDALPGVESAAYSGWPLVSGYSGDETDFAVPGYTPVSGKKESVTYNPVGENFFETYQMPFVLGHGFSLSDKSAASKTAVINQALAKKYFGQTSPIGKYLHLIGSREIIGIVRDVKQTDVKDPPPPTVFILGAPDGGAVHFAVRTRGDPVALTSAIRQAAGEVDQNLPLINVRTQVEQVKWRLTLERLFSGLAGFLGVLSLTLVCVGLYGLISFAVHRRTSEIGLRMALGALPRRMLWMLLRESLVPVGIGTLLGIGAAWAATRVLAKFLFGLSPTDPLTYASVTLILSAVVLIASWLPARRAAKIDPMVALRTE